jgi:hypothetical protein
MEPPIPPCRTDIRRTASREQSIVPKTFVAKTCATACAGSASTRNKPPVTPALFTSPPIGPSSRTAASNNRRISSSRLTSAAIATARPPLDTISRTTSSAAALCVKKFTATGKPFAPTSLAIAAPIPRLAPVTIAARWFSPPKTCFCAATSRIAGLITAGILADGRPRALASSAILLPQTDVLAPSFCFGSFVFTRLVA